MNLTIIRDTSLNRAYIKLSLIHDYNYFKRDDTV